MKRIFFILIMAGSLITMASCSDDSQTIEPSPLQIVKSDIKFTALGGTGTVTVTSTTPIASATSSDSWCTLEVTTDTTVSVTAQPYTGKESRNALITITDGNGNEAHVAASQTGAFFFLEQDSVVVGDTPEGTVTVGMKHSSDVTITNSADWIHVEASGDALTFSIDDNTTGNVRSSKVYVSSLDMTDSVFVLQFEHADIVGDYYFGGIVNSTDSLAYLNATLADNGDGTMKLSFPDLNWSGDLAFNDNNGKLNLPGGVYWGTLAVDNGDGTSTTYYVYDDLWDTTQGYITWAGTRSADYSFQSYNGSTIAILTDNGSWSGYNVTGIVFDLFTAQEAISSNRARLYAARFMSAHMIKKSSSNAKTTLTLPSYIRKPSSGSTTDFRIISPWQLTPHKNMLRPDAFHS